mmetsp:Transcript_15372/g.17563  ORF Transcript_15372/g.17563 Transcript_15372/m.17563 type:complete len:239 (+) Transcript_15372:233-949(+)
MVSWSLIVSYALVSASVFIISLWLFGICGKPDVFSIGRPEAERRNETVTPTISAEERIHNRRLYVLTNIIHKKVLTKANEENNENISLPPKETLPKKSTRLNERDTSGELPHSSDHMESFEDNNIKTATQKDDIYVSTTKNNKSTSSSTSMVISIQSIRQFINWKQETATSALYSAKHCPICIEPYQEGEEICWSKNDRCRHAFHLDCIMTWLMKHDDCPVCRANYLTETSNGDDNRA